MRVTFAASFRATIDDVNQSAQQLADIQKVVSSGKKIIKPSDDPAGAAAAISDHAALGVLDAYTSTANSAPMRLSMLDTTLSDMINQITAAQTAVAGARGSSAGQSQRDAAAGKLQQISDALLGDFNAQSHGTYLLSGTSATTAPFTKTGATISAYQGNTQSTTVDVSPQRSLQVSFDGGAIAQGSDATDIFTVLSTVAAAVTAGDSAGMQAGLDALDRALTRATTAQSQVGTNLSTLDDSRLRLTSQQLDVKTNLSATEDANMAAAITQMSQADTAYRAALGALGRISTVSLMDYLK